MPESLDNTMEEASVALARMDYLECEELCQRSLVTAFHASDWGYFASILLPLQEARRQRRMIAAEGVIRLGSVDVAESSAAMLRRMPAGCIVLTHPHTSADAVMLVTLARQQRRHVEVLFADNPRSSGRWVLSWPTPSIRVEINAPPAEWVGRWITPETKAAPAGAAPTLHPVRKPLPKPTSPAQSPADWFLDACEAMGDAALAGIDADKSLSPRGRLERLWHALLAVTDHERLHQALAAAARDLRRASA